MKSVFLMRAILSVAAFLGVAVVASAQPAPVHPGRAVYDQYCASCHDNAEATGAPTLSALQEMSETPLRAALTTGVMQAQGGKVSRPQFEDLIAFLASPMGADDGWITSSMCPANRRAVDLSRPVLQRFGVDYLGARRMTARQAGLNSKDAANLEVAWTFAMPNSTELRGQGVIIGSTLFYPSPQTGHVLAFDVATGCIKWAYVSPAPIRTSLSYGPLGKGGAKALVFADTDGMVQTVDAKTGALIWRVDGGHVPNSRITGSPILWNDRIIVPVSGGEAIISAQADYICCKQSGAVTALDARTGRKLWVARTMQDARPTGVINSAGNMMWGPSGAPVWSTPTIDEKRGVVYLGTGENTSAPATKTSDAIWAIDLRTGETKWFFQALERDIWNSSCRGAGRDGPNCPFRDESVTKDFDFGASVIVVRGRGGADYVLAGQKSGDVWALTPGGEKIWRTTYGRGSALGGVHWGMTTDGKRLFVPLNDTGAAGLYALDVATGKELWRYARPAECTAATPGPGGRGAERPAAPSPANPNCPPVARLSVAPVMIDNSVVAAALDGRIMVFDADSGALAATYETNHAFPSANGVAAKGGAIDAHSLWAGAGHVFVASGYARFGQTAGNVLIAYRPRKN